MIYLWSRHVMLIIHHHHRGGGVVVVVLVGFAPASSTFVLLSALPKSILIGVIVPWYVPIVSVTKADAVTPSMPTIAIIDSRSVSFLML